MFEKLATKTLLYIIGIVIIVGLVLGAVWKFNRWLDAREQAIRDSMRAQFTIEQQKLIQQKQDEFLQQMITLQRSAETLQIELQKKEREIDVLADQIAEDAAKSTTGADDLVAPYLREIISGLRKTFP